MNRAPTKASVAMASVGGGWFCRSWIYPAMGCGFCGLAGIAR